MSIRELTKKNFYSQVNKGITLVDFWAPWCGPCKTQLMTLEEISKCVKNKVTIAKVNVESEKDLSSEFQVMSIPTILLFQEGVLIDKMIGIQSKAVLLKKLNL